MMHVNVLVKPASSACNMNCSYCFYQDVANCREVGFKGFLTLERMEQIIVGTMEYAEKSCTFLFQGGEPVLAGLDFYRGVVELEKKHGKPGVRIYNSLQTNGYEVGEEMARFFAENHFLIGVSLDGPESVHDANRRDRRGGGTFARVMETLELFDRVGVEYNILCVVTGENARRAGEIYGFYRERGFEFLQFIPCLEPLEGAQREAGAGAEVPETSERVPHDALTPEAYGEFLTEIFDLWFRDLKNGKYVSVRHLDNWMAILLGGQPASCGMVGRCSIQFVVEGDGGVYPCDFYVLDEWRLGTVGQESFAVMGTGEKAREFLEQSVQVPESCKACRYYVLCRNGCRRDRAEDGMQNIYCGAYRKFFAAREKELEAAAGMLARFARR